MIVHFITYSKCFPASDLLKWFHFSRTSYLCILYRKYIWSDRRVLLTLTDIWFLTSFLIWHTITYSGKSLFSEWECSGPSPKRMVCACALRWKHLSDCPVAVSCGIVSHPRPLVFLFTRRRLKFCLTSDNIMLCCCHVSRKKNPKPSIKCLPLPVPSSLTLSMTCGK